MQILTLGQFNHLIAATPLKPRIKRELRFVKSTQAYTDTDWNESELIAITERTDTRGVLILAPDDAIYVLPYELKRGIVSHQTGRAQPIICDFCRTWQTGSRAGSIVFTTTNRSVDTIGYLCCGDLACSRHVRSKTSAARTSRAQLREDISDGQRVARLKDRLRTIIQATGATPISPHEPKGK